MVNWRSLGGWVSRPILWVESYKQSRGRVPCWKMRSWLIGEVWRDEFLTQFRGSNLIKRAEAQFPAERTFSLVNHCWTNFYLWVKVLSSPFSGRNIYGYNAGQIDTKPNLLCLYNGFWRPKCAVNEGFEPSISRSKLVFKGFRIYILSSISRILPSKEIDSPKEKNAELLHDIGRASICFRTNTHWAIML